MVRFGVDGRNLLIVFAFVFALIPQTRPQAPLPEKLESELPDAPSPSAMFAPVGKPVSYTSAGESREFHNYLYEAFGPYPLITNVIVAAYHQARHNPPDWREGMAGFGQRYTSDFATGAINVSTRYALAEALDEDVYYYRCTCTGVWPRLRHALVSVVVARNRISGNPEFSLPGVVAPYAGPMVATRAWLPERYNLKDGFRMGNYGLVDYAIGNIGLEFLPSLTHTGAKSIVKRFHFENRHAAENANTP